MSRPDSTGPVANAYRAAGFVQLKRLWVTQEDLALIMYMAERHKPELERIRQAALDAYFGPTPIPYDDEQERR